MGLLTDTLKGDESVRRIAEEQFGKLREGIEEELGINTKRKGL